jgi:hypothetical protein
VAITLSSAQVLALAPDGNSAAAGKKLANTKHWKNLGQDAQAVWGECQGSALYQVRADLSGTTVKCTCPSRKQPCKHVLGLLLLAATDAGAVPSAEPPEWVAAWLAKRAAASAPKEVKKESAKSPAQVAAEQVKRAAKRLALVQTGLDGLDLWLSDLVRNGLSVVETQPDMFTKQAARLVDSQAPGIATRLRRMAGIPGSSRDWGEKLLGEMGRLALLTHAFHRLDALDPALQEDVRGLIGWTLEKEEVAERGEHVAGEWLVLGQWIEDDDPRVRTQRTWLAEAETGRPALVLQFIPNAQRADVGGSLEVFVPGTRFAAELHFWPSAYPLRARLAERRAELSAISTRLAGAASIEAHLSTVADALMRQPWLDRFPCVLRDMVPGCAAGGKDWHVRDREGAALPLSGGEHWRLLALSGGFPVDLAGEWDGETLLPLGVMAEGVYAPLWGVS